MNRITGALDTILFQRKERTVLRYVNSSTEKKNMIIRIFSKRQQSKKEES
jgi:hypothetical protein